MHRNKAIVALQQQVMKLPESTPLLPLLHDALTNAVVDFMHDVLVPMSHRAGLHPLYHIKTLVRSHGMRVALTVTRDASVT